MNDFMNNRPNAKLRRSALFEDRRNVIAIRETNGCSRCIHQKLLGQIACNGFLILQQEFLELKYVVEVPAAGRDTRGIDFLPDVVNKLVAAPALHSREYRFRRRAPTGGF